jgi:hypothetical protein
MQALFPQRSQGARLVVYGVQDTGGEFAFCGDLWPILRVVIQSRFRASPRQLAGDSLCFALGGGEKFDEVTPPVILISRQDQGRGFAALCANAGAGASWGLV